jgi:bacillithiol system protein YtxJ
MGLFSFGKSNSKKLDWIELNSMEELDQAIENSSDRAAIFFKHSTRCSISSMALNRFENDWKEDAEGTLYFIDLIKNRDVSNALSEKADVYHQSPQAIVLKDKKAIYDASHSSISATEIIKKLN